MEYPSEMQCPECHGTGKLKLRYLRDYIRAYMGSEDLSYRGVAERLGITLSMVSRIMNGHKSPKANAVLRVTDALGLPAEQVVEIIRAEAESDGK